MIYEHLRLVVEKASVFASFLSYLPLNPPFVDPLFGSLCVSFVSHCSLNIKGIMYVWLIFISSVLSSPLLFKRYDLDHDGTPDMCYEDNSGSAHCMEANGVISVIPSTLAKTTSTAASAPTIASPPPSPLGGQPSPVSAPVPTNTNIASSGGQANGFPSDATTFGSQKGTKWTLDVLPRTDAGQNLGDGAIYFNSINRLGCDKGRTSSLNGKVFWNFGDCLSVDGLAAGSAAGFSMGAAFYGDAANPLEVNTNGITSVSDWDFAKPWTDSPNPDPVSTDPASIKYGMDTSNTAEISANEGIAFAWEILRGGQSSTDEGLAMLHVTLGDQVPMATRKEGLITDSSKLQIGSMTVFNPNVKNSPKADGYLYMYSNSPTTYGSVVVGRVPVADAFDPKMSNYQFLKTGGDWDAAGTIPDRSATGYGMQGSPVSNAQGSIMYNEYLGKYMLWTSAMASVGGFYLADTPTGPWSEFYQVLTKGADAPITYGMNVHPDLLPDSNGKQLLVSWGTSAIITMYKLSFEY